MACRPDPPACLLRRRFGAAVAGLLAAVAVSVTPAEEPAGPVPGPMPDLATRPGEDWGGFLGPTGNGRSGLLAGDDLCR